MSRDVIARRRGALLRGLALWSAVTLALLTLPTLLASELGLASGLLRGEWAGRPFDALLAAGCAAVLCACATWAWLITTGTLVLALLGSTRRVPGCPDAARRLVLAACGLVVVAVTTAPAHADPGAGSPPTPTPTSEAAGHARPAPAGESPATVQVRPGDSLWALAAQDLPHDATDAEVDGAWRALWAANRQAVGDDPDLIHPGTQLRRPTPKEHR